MTLQRVLGLVRRCQLRQLRLNAAARGFLWGSIFGSVGIVAARLAGLAPAPAAWFGLVAVAGTVLALGLRRTTVPDDYRIAKQIDGELGLKDRLAGGYDLLKHERPAADPFTALAVRDAEAAAQQAEPHLHAHLRLPRRLFWGAACLILATAVSLALPGGVRATTVSREQREQAEAFNASLTNMAESIKAMEGLDPEAERSMLEALNDIRISEEDLRRMSRADVIRRLKEANERLKIPEGAQGTVFRQAVEDRLKAIAEMEQVQKQLAEIEALNRRQAVLDLGEGRQAQAVNIKLESSDLNLDQAVAAAAAAPGQAQQEYQRRQAEAEARAAAEREKIKRFLARTTQALPPGEAAKLAAMVAGDPQFQEKLMQAIKDPSGKQYDAMREIYRRQLEQEFEKENIPRGLRNQLSTYLGR